METITVQARSDIITAQSGRKYFTITDDTQRKLLCFNPSLLELLPLGATVKDVDIQPGKKADDTPRIVRVGEVGKESPKTRFTPKGRDEDRTDHRNAIITVKDLWLGGKLNDANPLVTWLLAELLIIATGEKRAKVEIVSVIEKATPKVAIVEEEPKNAKELLNWIIFKDPAIKMPRTWLNENFAVDSKTVLNPEKVKELYEAIKIGMGW